MKAVEVNSLVHRYGDRIALNGISFSVEKGQMFGLVGPNGGGKSTTFKILATLLSPTGGSVSEFGVDVAKDASSVRRKLGVVFQAPALDKKLTVRENLLHQGHLYGMMGADLEERIEALLVRFGLADRRDDKAEILSGGLKRRVEIAPSAHPPAGAHSPSWMSRRQGLDPLARREVWDHLKKLRDREGITLLLTTHLLDEAEECHEIAFLDAGEIVLFGKPQELKDTVGEDILALRSKHPELLKQKLEQKFGASVKIVDGEVRLQHAKGHELIPELVSTFRDDIDAVTLAKPTLEDLFIKHTGRRLAAAAEGQPT